MVPLAEMRTRVGELGLGFLGEGAMHSESCLAHFCIQVQYGKWHLDLGSRVEGTVKDEVLRMLFI